MVFMITLTINIHDITHTQSFGQSLNFPNLLTPSSINKLSKQLKTQLSLLAYILFRFQITGPCKKILGI